MKALREGDSDTVLQYYQKKALRYEQPRQNSYHRFLDQRLLAWLKGFLSPSSRVLEVGCGTGMLLEQLRGGAASMQGVDISPNMLARARARGLDVCQGSATELPFAEGSFDLVYCFRVLPHIEAADRALAEMHRVLRPHGLLLVDFYNRFSMRALRLAVRALLPGADTLFTRLDSAAGAATRLERAGFEILDRLGLSPLTPAGILHQVPLLGRLLRRGELALERRAAAWGAFLCFAARRAR